MNANFRRVLLNYQSNQIKERFRVRPLLKVFIITGAGLQFSSLSKILAFQITFSKVKESRTE